MCGAHSKKQVAYFILETPNSKSSTPVSVESIQSLLNTTIVEKSQSILHTKQVNGKTYLVPELFQIGRGYDRKGHGSILPKTKKEYVKIFSGKFPLNYCCYRSVLILFLLVIYLSY